MPLKRFDELVPGDLVMGSDGQPVRVVEAYETHIPATMWEIELDNGTVIKASGNHLWYCETVLDWELLRERRKIARKHLRKLRPETIALLEETAGKTQVVETRLIDMVVLLQATDNAELFNTIIRVAESIGHIAENSEVEQDMGTDDSRENVVRSYDARLFAQQLLKLTGFRKYRKYDLIVGSIMTTDQMMELGETIHLPIVQPR